MLHCVVTEGAEEEEEDLKGNAASSVPANKKITVLQLVALDEGMQGLSGIQVRVDVYSISMQACA